MDDYESFKKAVYSLTKIDLSSYKEKQSADVSILWCESANAHLMMLMSSY